MYGKVEKFQKMLVYLNNIKNNLNYQYKEKIL